ncbi:hypothetical protein GOBAR_AA15511 [Gossypium barbadense]|uniref:Uncharacterized protein n=1 Tax=Gossypium barbadense TaxID=3634 RepID=A0A2P5XP65_GOSBA|nr:hypothetical protein GOBAR_AA15511 [Gossypium barbadense]
MPRCAPGGVEPKPPQSPCPPPPAVYLDGRSLDKPGEMPRFFGISFAEEKTASHPFCGKLLFGPAKPKRAWGRRVGLWSYNEKATSLEPHALKRTALGRRPAAPRAAPETR